MTFHWRCNMVWGASLAFAGASLFSSCGASGVSPAVAAAAADTNHQPAVSAAPRAEAASPAPRPRSATPAPPSTRSTAGAASTAPAASSAPAASTAALVAKPSSERAYTVVPVSADLQKDFLSKGFKLEPKSGNYLSPRIFGKTPSDDLVPVRIGGAFVNDERGNPVFLRKSLYDKLLKADAALFKEKHKHIIVGYGFRSNAVQAELYNRLKGHAKVAPPGTSFHETGMAIDVINTREAHKHLINAGFQGGCDGIGEDRVHYSIGEVTEASDFKTFRRCSVPGLFDHILFFKKKKS